MLKTVILSVLLLTASAALYAQELPDYGSIRLEKQADYPLAENTALQASNYLLTTPIAKDNLYRLKTMQFLIKWMEGTPDYTFSLDGPITRISENSADIIAVYMAAMVKFCLENKAQSKDMKAIKLSAVKSLIAYCSDASNGVKVKGELKRLKEADERGVLQKYVGN